MAYHRRRNTATKQESRQIRANTEAAIKALPLFQAGKWFTRKYVQEVTGKEPSVITMALRDMEKANQIQARISDSRGTLEFVRVPSQLHWRPTNPDPDCQPRYY